MSEPVREGTNGVLITKETLFELAKLISERYPCPADLAGDALMVYTHPPTMFSPHSNDYINAKWLTWCLDRMEDFKGCSGHISLSSIKENNGKEFVVTGLEDGQYKEFGRSTTRAGAVTYALHYFLKSKWEWSLDLFQLPEAETEESK